MPSTTTETLTAPLRSLSLRSDPEPKSAPAAGQVAQDDSNYKYKRFLPSFDPSIHLPPLEPFEHVDPGELQHSQGSSAEA